MRPNRWLPAVLSLCLATRAAAQSTAPAAEWQAPPTRYLIVTPITGFPDPLAASLAMDVRPGITAEAGVAALAPGAFARLGVYTPLESSARHGTDLMAYGGYRAITLPLLEEVHGPTLGVGVRRWPRGGGWGWQVNTGLWITNQESSCAGCESVSRILLPEVRVAAMRAR